MAMFTVDHEVGNERQHGILIVNFGHPYNTRVGERHWPISTFLMQLAKGGNVLIDAERNPERAPFSRSPNKAQYPRGNLASRCIASARTGSHTSSGGCSSSIRSMTQG
jgi:hypothetical protein